MSAISDALPYGLREDAAVLAALRRDQTTHAGTEERTAPLGALFDRYHQWLYGILMRTLRDHETTIAAMAQALGAVAAARLSRPEQVRPAMARATYESCLRIGESRGRLRGRPTTDPSQLQVEITEGGRDGELRRLVWRAMETLTFRERLLFEFEWHDRLDSRDLVGVIGGRNGQATLNRARDRVKATLTTAVAVWYGSERCVNLRRLVRHAGAAEGKAGSMRVVIEQHLYGGRGEQGCAICADSQDKYALAVLGAVLPVFVVPPGLRERVLALAVEHRRGMRTPLTATSYAPSGTGSGLGEAVTSRLRGTGTGYQPEPAPTAPLTTATPSDPATSDPARSIPATSSPAPSGPARPVADATRVDAPSSLEEALRGDPPPPETPTDDRPVDDAVTAAIALPEPPRPTPAPATIDDPPPPRHRASGPGIPSRPPTFDGRRSTGRAGSAAAQKRKRLAAGLVAAVAAVLFSVGVITYAQLHNDRGTDNLAVDKASPSTVARQPALTPAGTPGPPDTADTGRGQPRDAMAGSTPPPTSGILPTSRPPTSRPPTSRPPTSKPPTSKPPTSKPPTSEPPTSEPPTSEPPSTTPSSQPVVPPPSATVPAVVDA